MADEGTLATTAQVLLAIGENASSDQILEANTNIWIKYAEAEIEKLLSETKGSAVNIVSNYSNIPSSQQQWLAMVASHRAAFHAIQQNQQSWTLDTTQSKLNVIDSIWRKAPEDMGRQDIVENLNL